MSLANLLMIGANARPCLSCARLIGHALSELTDYSLPQSHSPPLQSSYQLIALSTRQNRDSPPLRFIDCHNQMLYLPRCPRCPLLQPHTQPPAIQGSACTSNHSDHQCDHSRQEHCTGQDSSLKAEDWGLVLTNQV